MCIWAAIIDLLITLIYYFFFCLISHQEGFQLFKYYLSKISTYRNIKLKKIVAFIFLVFLANFFKNFALKTYCTLKMVLSSAQNNYYVIMSSYVEGHVEKNIQDWISCLQLVSRPPKYPIIGPATYTFWMPSFSFWVFVILNFSQKKHLLFLVRDPIGSILVGFRQ